MAEKLATQCNNLWRYKSYIMFLQLNISPIFIFIGRADKIGAVISEIQINMAETSYIYTYKVTYFGYIFFFLNVSIIHFI